MGLDMYLTREISGKKVEVGYWRKANQIHAWFVNNVQDGVDECQRTLVPVEKLVELRTICEKLLRAVETSSDAMLEEDVREWAMALLPPQCGFFFGSTEIDEGYFADLADTVKILKDVEKLSGRFYYQSSW